MLRVQRFGSLVSFDNVVYCHMQWASSNCVSHQVYFCWLCLGLVTHFLSSPHVLSCEPINFVYGDLFRFKFVESQWRFENVLPSAPLQAEQLMFGYSCSQENERASHNERLGKCPSAFSVPGRALDDEYPFQRAERVAMEILESVNLFVRFQAKQKRKVTPVFKRAK